MRQAQLVVWMVAASLGLVCSAAPAQETKAGTDWPQFRGPLGNGVVAALPDKMPAAQPLWKLPVKGECHAGIAVAEGVALVPDTDPFEDGGDMDEAAAAEADAKHFDYYHCVDLEKGTLKWSAKFKNGREMEYGPGPRATPLIHKGKAYVCSAFGELYCLDLKDGKVLWQKSFDKDFKAGEPPGWGFCSSPLLADGKLIIHPANLVALNPDTGETIWEGKAGGSNYATGIVAKLGGVEQVVTIDGSSAGGWDLKTGARLWKLPLSNNNGYIVPGPVQVGDKLLIQHSEDPAKLYEFEDGGKIKDEPVGECEELATEVTTPTAVGDLVLAQGDGLLCLDAKKLEALWSYNKEPALRSDFHIIAAGDRVLAFNSSGTLVLGKSTAKGFELIGKAKVCGNTLMHPTVAGGKLLVRDNKNLLCFDLGMGK